MCASVAQAPNTPQLTANMNTDLSVVVVSYNTKEMTEACLASLFNNVGNLRAQVILVDNNSADGSVEMVKEKFPNVELIENSDNRGFAVANNQGFEISTGKFVLLLNSDTVVLGDVLEKSVGYLKNRADVGAMGCRVLNADKTMQPTCSGYPTLGRLFLLTTGLDRVFGIKALDQYLLRHWQRDSERDVEVISGCYLMLRREVLEQVGGLDERFFFFGEETDWCLQMRRAGWALRFAPVGEIIHHGGGSVKKLNYKRDVMLTDATIRLHRKNGGRFAAIVAFLILLVFNGSRAALWSLRATWRANSRPRAEHFRNVFTSSFSTWPRG